MRSFASLWCVCHDYKMTYDPVVSSTARVVSSTARVVSSNGPGEMILTQKKMNDQTKICPMQKADGSAQKKIHLIIDEIILIRSRLPLVSHTTIILTKKIRTWCPISHVMTVVRCSKISTPRYYKISSYYTQYPSPKHTDQNISDSCCHHLKQDVAHPTSKMHHRILT